MLAVIQLRPPLLLSTLPGPHDLLATQKKTRPFPGLVTRIPAVRTKRGPTAFKPLTENLQNLAPNILLEIWMTPRKYVLHEESPRPRSGSLWYLRDFNFYSYLPVSPKKVSLDLLQS